MNNTRNFLPRGLFGLLVCGCVGSAVGCGGSVDETASDIATPDGGSSSSSTSASTSDSAASFPSYTADQVATAQAACSQPDSAVVTYDSTGKLQSLLQGSWFYCGPYGTQYDAMPVGAAGMQFTSDMEFRWLVIDASGTLTSAVSPVDIDAPDFTFTPATSVPAGESAEGARIGYSFLPFTGAAVNNVDGQINVEYADRSTMSTRATFEGTHQRLHLEFWDNAFVYVGP